MLERRWFAQDREDKRLYNALKHIKEGTYVDIGAYEPEFNSVTKVFYDDGWSGINVEPNPRAFAMLREGRLRDTNIQKVVTYKKGPQVLYLTEGRGWSSLKPDVAKAANQHGMKTEPIAVESITLDELWPECDVHFLKIDVEGAEDQVIASNDWKRNRPWVVVAEHNVPQSGRTEYHSKEWKGYLESRGYVFKLDDRLNIWFVAEERLDNVGEFVL